MITPSIRTLCSFLALLLCSRYADATPTQHRNGLAPSNLKPPFHFGVAGLRRHRSKESTLVSSKNNIQKQNAILYASTSNTKAIQSPNQPEPTNKSPSTAEIYRNLNPIGKCVAGTIEIGFQTVLEYISGFTGGYLLGSATDLPRFTFDPVNPNQPLLNELGQRYVRMHSKSFRWAKTWGSISAVFGGCRIATKVVRGGQEDEWNSVLSSAAAGAFFARKKGPQGMVRRALMYGGIMYLLAGGMGRKQELFEYDDEPYDY